MKKIMKILRLSLVLLLIASMVLVGCQKDEKTDKPADTNNISEEETLEPVHLVGYVLGDRPMGMDDVLEQLNKKLTEDINATMEINYIGWGDFNTKYPLVLAAGEDIDWIFTASWAFYEPEASKGAFYELDEEMIKKYMPLHYAATPDQAWQETLIKAKMYMIPTSTAAKNFQLAAVRRDLMEKYNVPDFDKFSEITPYLEAIKENEPGMIPMNLGNFDAGTTFWGLLPDYTELLGFNNTAIVRNWSDPVAKFQKVTDPEILPLFKEAAEQVKFWYDSGYINKNAFANKVQSRDSFEQGKSGVALCNFTDSQNLLAKAKENGWDIKIIPFFNSDDKFADGAYVGNGVALAAKTKNPERTLMALDLIMEDPEYNQLVYYGVEGKNYVIEDGKIALPEGVTADTNTYPIDTAGFWFTNKNQLLPLASWSDEYIAIRNSLEDHVIADPLNGIPVLDVDEFKTELANLKEVCQQYYAPLSMGIIEDVDAAFEKLDEKLTAAGIDKLLENLQEFSDGYNAGQ